MTTIFNKTRKQRIRLSSRSGNRSWSLPPLRFTPYAWAKLLFLRDLGPTEVGGFGISSLKDPLLVEDVLLILQQCSAVTVKFDDAAVADFFDDQVDEGRVPEEFARIWIHTHPGNSALPSCTDEETFSRSFGEADWAVMFILASGGRTYARMRFSAGPGGETVLPVEVDFSQPFGGSAVDDWEVEYQTSVRAEQARKSQADCARGIENPIDMSTGKYWPDTMYAFDAPSSLWPWEPRNG